MAGVREDLAKLSKLPGRAEVLAATDHHPYARVMTSGTLLHAFTAEDTVVWLTRGPYGVSASGLGDPETTLRLFSRLAGQGVLDGVRRVNLPRLDRDRILAQLPLDNLDEWDFLWTYQPPPAQPGEQRVRPLPDTAGPAIEALLERAFPDTFTRPGDPQIRRWYGIWDGTTLVACGADRSRAGVGSLSAITVESGQQGRGLGAALTAAMTRALFADCDVVSLGVMADNHRAYQLYQRLGFTEVSQRSAGRLRTE